MKHLIILAIIFYPLYLLLGHAAENHEQRWQPSQD